MTQQAIVVAIDFSDITPYVMERTRQEALLRPDATVHLVHVLPAPVIAPAAGLVPNLATEMNETIERTRKELQKIGEATGLKGRLVGHVRIGSPVEELIGVAHDASADLIVVGASAKGLIERALLGSTANGLLRRAPCSVLIARPMLHDPEIEPPRPDQNDDVHKRHHPQGHTYSELPDGVDTGATSFRF
jgi:nucleotide-binding universal stress UspA family protein